MYIYISEHGLQIVDSQETTCKHEEVKRLIGKSYVDLRKEFSDEQITVWCNDENNVQKKYKHTCTLPDGTHIHGNVLITGYDEDDEGNQQMLTRHQIELVKKEIKLV